MGCTSSNAAAAAGDASPKSKVRGHGIKLRSPSSNSVSTDPKLLDNKPDLPQQTLGQGNFYDISPALVVKAMRAGAGQKIFINIYQTDDIFDEGIVLLPIVAVDHKGTPTSVYPALLSSECVQKSKTDVHFMEQVVLQVLNNINKCFPACKLETTTVKLPKIKKGFIGEQMQQFSKSLQVHTIIFTGQRLQLDNDDEMSVAGSVAGFAPAARGSISEPNGVRTFAQTHTPSFSTTPSAPSAATAAGDSSRMASPEENKPPAPQPAAQSKATPAPAPAPAARQSNAGPASSSAPSSKPPPLTLTNPTPGATAGLASQSTAGRPAPAPASIFSGAPAPAPVPSSAPVPRPTSTASVRPTISSVPLPTPPPLMVGWARKQGHIYKNWTNRNFVLNRGVMIYYTESLTEPRYGDDPKGMFSLAGYRELNSSQPSISMASATAPRRSFSIFGARPDNMELRIHLRLESSILHAMLPDHSETKKIYQGMLTKTASTIGLSRGADPSPEFIIECGVPSERLAWIAAIDAHTQYVEDILRLHSTHSKLDISQVIDPLDFSSVSEPSQAQDEDSTPVVDAAEEVRPSTVSFSQAVVIQPAESVHRLGEDENYRQLSTSQGGPARPYSNGSALPTTSAPPQASGGRPVTPSVASGMSFSSTRSMSMVGKNNKFLQFLQPNEVVQRCGLVTRSNAIGIPILSDLVLLVNQNLEVDANTAVMRLLVIDANSYKLDAEIKWTKSVQPTVPSVKLSDKVFTVIYQRRTYKFTPKDKVSAFEWVAAIDALPV